MEEGFLALAVEGAGKKHPSTSLPLPPLAFASHGLNPRTVPLGIQGSGRCSWQQSAGRLTPWGHLLENGVPRVPFPIQNPSGPCSVVLHLPPGGQSLPAPHPHLHHWCPSCRMGAEERMKERESNRTRAQLSGPCPCSWHPVDPDSPHFHPEPVTGGLAGQEVFAGGITFRSQMGRGPGSHRWPKVTTGSLKVE